MSALVEEAAAAVGLDGADRGRLAALHAILASQLPEIADTLCAAARAHPLTERLLSDPAQLELARWTLIHWMSSGLLGPHDDAFHARRSKIAVCQVEHGLPPYLSILAIGIVRSAYHERVANAYEAGEARLVSRAIDRLFDLELVVLSRDYQVFAESHVSTLSERRRRAERFGALKTLTAGLAHEIRNPLNSAKLQLELAERRLRRLGDDPKLVEPIELAHHEIGRLTQLVDEFLAFARPLALDAHDHDVVAVVREVLELERPAAVRRHASLALVGDPHPTVAEVDVPKLRQVIDNIVVNAIEAVPEGGHVSVAVVPIDGHVHIRVTDNGAGIPVDVLQRIYEPFFSTKDGGTGMGMSIVHSLVALHHGTIEVTSSPAGTTFNVTLPRRGKG